jgi:hypothetical protein
MTKALGTKRLGRAASAGAFGLVVLAACAGGSALAQEERPENDPSIWNLDTRMWNSLMSAMGMKTGTEVGIDYRERSPLVVPPQPNLPPPESRTPKSAAWPVDPDVKRRQQANVKKPRNVYAGDIEVDGRNLTPSELNLPGGRTANPQGSNASGPNENLAPSELGYFGGLFSWKGFGFGRSGDEVATFTAEPPRMELTAPPAGYQTPSPAQPYGTTKRIEQAKPAKIEDWGNK